MLCSKFHVYTALLIANCVTILVYSCLYLTVAEGLRAIKVALVEGQSNIQAWCMHFISHQSQVSLSGPLSFVAPCDFRTLKGIKETSISLKVWHTKVSCEINTQLFS